MSDNFKTLTDRVLEAEEKDTPKLLLRIAMSIESTTRSIGEINQQFEGISTRLKQGDKVMDEIQSKINKLPCNRITPFCPSPKDPWGKTKITAIGTVAASIIMVIIETVKRLMP